MHIIECTHTSNQRTIKKWKTLFLTSRKKMPFHAQKYTKRFIRITSKWKVSITMKIKIARIDWLGYTKKQTSSPNQIARKWITIELNCAWIQANLFISTQKKIRVGQQRYPYHITCCATATFQYSHLIFSVHNQNGLIRFMFISCFTILFWEFRLDIFNLCWNFRFLSRLTLLHFFFGWVGSSPYL